MLGCPATDGYDGPGVFSHACKLSHPLADAGAVDAAAASEAAEVRGWSQCNYSMGASLRSEGGRRPRGSGDHRGLRSGAGGRGGDGGARGGRRGAADRVARRAASRVRAAAGVPAMAGELTWMESGV